MIITWGLTILAVVFVGFLIVAGRYLSIWLQAYFSGTRVSLLELVLMTLRQVDPKIVVQCKVMAAQSGLVDLPTHTLEAQYLAGGNVHRVTLALIAASRSGIDLDWNTAAAIDLAGRDIMEAVRVSVNPKVINCPDPKDGHSDMLYAVAKDGIQLKVRVRVTVRTNMAQLVGGATEATIIARVGQGIISAIGSCDSYLEAIGDPTVITRQVLAKGLDSQTAFAIVSIDIADIDVGVNIGATLQMDQANADIRIARADAEIRRSMAIARWQEMRAQVAGSHAMLVRAEADVPTAMATAFRAGQVHSKHSGTQRWTRSQLGPWPTRRIFWRA